MPPFSIVPQLDVFEQSSSRFLASFPVLTMHELLLQRGEETLRNSIVLAIALPAHAAFDAVLGKQFPVISIR